MTIISEAGLEIGTLLEKAYSNNSFIDAMHFHLNEQTLVSVNLKFFDWSGSVLENGFGRWKFKVKYDRFGRGQIEFPVKNIVKEIRLYHWKFDDATHYDVELSTKLGSRNEPGWATIGQTNPRYCNEVFVDSFSWDPIEVTVYRE